MLKYFVYKNTYFIIGCLVLILLMSLFSNYKTNNMEGFTYGITKESYDSSITCGSSWKPVNSSSGFNFKNDNYNPIYMLSTSSDDITQLFDNYKSTTFNTDCSNVLYSVNNNNYSKYVYNNSAIKYNSSLLTENSSIGNFYDCFKLLSNDTNPTIYFDYNSKNANKTELTLTMINVNNSKNKYVFTMNLKSSGKTYMDEKLKQFLNGSHNTYSSTTEVSGFLVKILKDTTKCDMTIYKKSGSNDKLTNINSPTIPTLISDLSDHILSMYNSSDKSRASRYNLIANSSKVKYMYGEIEYGENQDATIVQIPNFTS